MEKEINPNKNRIVPSAEWKPEERINVAAFLAEQLSESARRSHVDRGTVFDVSERIQLVLTMPSDILEANRQDILKGKTTNPTK